MKMKLFLKKNIKVIIAFCLGLIISGGGVYAATAAASDISYSPPSGSGLSSNVQSAISELYDKSVYTKNIYYNAYQHGRSTSPIKSAGYTSWSSYIDGICRGNCGSNSSCMSSCSSATAESANTAANYYYNETKLQNAYKCGFTYGSHSACSNMGSW